MTHLPTESSHLWFIYSFRWTQPQPAIINELYIFFNVRLNQLGPDEDFFFFFYILEKLCSLRSSPEWIPIRQKQCESRRLKTPAPKYCNNSIIHVQNPLYDIKQVVDYQPWKYNYSSRDQSSVKVSICIFWCNTYFRTEENYNQTQLPSLSPSSRLFEQKQDKGVGEGQLGLNCRYKYSIRTRCETAAKQQQMKCISIRFKSGFIFSARRKLIYRDERTF